MNSEIKPYKTKDLGLAAFLKLSGVTPLKTVRSGSGDAQYFIFVWRDDIAELTETYFGRHSVEMSPFEYNKAMRYMKRMLQDPWEAK